jgi:hypothetical protein
LNSQREPSNPFYFLFLLASLLFVVTALAWAVVPTLEDKAKAVGEMPPPSPWREALREDGGRWLLCQLGGMIFFGLASMGLDRLRRLQKERASATMPERRESTTTPNSG